jgi:hypothetical protein
LSHCGISCLHPATQKLESSLAINDFLLVLAILPSMFTNGSSHFSHAMFVALEES